LNDKGELNCVTEIPQSNFLPVKGIVVKEEYDTTGVSYKSGTYANYYVQIGNDYELGMLNELAMIILAKKLGLGSWMSYIEKFGVPAVFAITDRQDDARAQELFKMLTSFRSNHFAILKGNEKVEIAKDTNADGYQSFDKLNLFCDSQLSKRILGGTGITDEKSFVGAAEIHERQLKYRIQVDKLIIKFYMNKEIMPRLVKLSSVYAPLANLTFDWDETETLTLKEKIEAVKDLSTSFNFDPKKLAELTGLPITTVKETLAASPQVQETQKKKPNASVAGANSLDFPFAKGEYPKGKGFIYIHAATWDAAIERLATQIYNGEIKPADLDKDLVLKNYSSLNKSAETSYGKGYYEDELTRKMRDNLMKFSGAKSYNLMTKLKELNVGGISKDAYIQQAKKIVTLHNESYLNVERTFAASSASSAKDWKQFIKDKDIYPNLKYRTMEDAEVREEHVVLDGIVKPLTDSFWTTHTPPNGFRCRCWVEQTMEDASIETPNLEIPEQFRNNPGENGVVFTNDNSYYKSIANKQHTIVSDNTNRMKQFAPYNRVEKSKGGNNIFINDFADASEVTQNRVAAEITADLLEKNVYIRAHINTSTKIKNPELAIGNTSTLCDLKTYDKDKSTSVRNFVKNNIGSANKQGCEYVVLDFTDADKLDFKKNAILKLRGELSDKNKMNTGIKQIIIINGKQSGILSRKQINSSEYLTYFESLFK